MFKQTFILFAIILVYLSGNLKKKLSTNTIPGPEQ